MQASTRLWNRSFTLVVAGQLASLTANNILHFVVSLYLLQLTGSPALFAGITAMSMLPMVLLTPVGGMLADRVNRRSLMVAFDAVSAVATLAFALVPGTGQELVWLGLFLMLLSALEAFYTPCVQACIPTLQRGDNITRANAIVSQIGMGTNIYGPVVAGLLYGFFGLMPILLVSGACFALSAVMECFIRMPFLRRPSEGGVLHTALMDMREGLAFVRGKRGLLRLMVAATGLNFLFASLFSVGFPYFITILWGYSEQLYGICTGALALAGLAGAVLAAVLAPRFKVQSSYWYFVWCGAAFLPVALGFAMGLPAGVLLALLVGGGVLMQVLGTLFSVVMVSSIQRITPAHLLGKVGALITTLAICAEPLGRAAYGGLFDALPGALGWILAFTGIAAMALGFSTRGTFRRDIPAALAQEETTMA